MRRIVLYIAMSLDGYLADPAGGCLLYTSDAADE